MTKKSKSTQFIFVSLKTFIVDVRMLMTSAPFILLTFLGNGLIGLFSLIFYFIEARENPKLLSFIDALWWGFSTATTTGYGDITPVTFQGKLLGILLMLTGTALFAMFTALFAETILISTKRSKND